MSVSFVTKLPDLVIPDGQTKSNSLSADEHYGDAAAIGIMPKALSSGTLSYEVSIDNINFATLEVSEPLIDKSVPDIGQAETLLELVAWPFFRISSDTPASGSMTIQATKHFTTGGGTW